MNTVMREVSHKPAVTVKPTSKLGLGKPQEPQYKPVREKQTYSTTRNGVTSYVTIDEVKKDDVKVKDHPSDKHSRTLSRSKLDKYYVLVG